MRHTMRQALAILIALLLALPVQGIGLGEEASGIALDDVAIDGELAIGPLDPLVDEIDDCLSDDLALGDLELPSDDSGESAPASPVPFDQTAVVDGVTFAVTAGAGAFPAESVLRIDAVRDGQTEKAAREAAEAAVEGPLVHHLYSIEVLDASGNACMPDGAVAMPVITVRGLDVPGEAHVILYDPVMDGYAAVEAQGDEEGLKFHFVVSAIYDIMGSASAPEQPEQPAEGKDTQPPSPVGEDGAQAPEEVPGDADDDETLVGDAADGDAAPVPPDGEPASPQGEALSGDQQSPDGQPASEEGQAPDGQPVSEEGQAPDGQPVSEEGQSPDGQPVSEEGQSPGGQPASEESQSPDGQPVSEEGQAPDEQPVSEEGQSLDEQPVSEEGQSPDGQYTQTQSTQADSAGEQLIIEADLSTDGQSAEAQPGEQPVAEPLPFDRSQTVSGVTVTVRAAPRAFPAGAALSVKRVPSYKKRAAAEAIDEVRDGNANVAVSYTFDIKVIDPETKEELQPAEGFGVEVSFALAEAADGNLEATVYHLTDERGELTAEALDTGAVGDAVTATTDGFSLYTVEFTYNNLEYVLSGGESVALSEILSALGLNGEAEAVSVSDASLFSASNATGAWVVESHRPFTTTEWMQVTIEGIPYEIAVTDDSFAITAKLDPEVTGQNVAVTVDGNPATSAVPGATVTLTVPGTGSPEALRYGLCSVRTDEETPVAVEFTATDTEGVYTFTMPSAGVTATFTRWAKLQEALGKGGTVTLGWDVAAVKDVDSRPLTVPAGVAATLDLNGHTVDRGLKDAGEALENGNVVTVSAGGSLIVKDTSQAGNGVITGGNNSESGGGVRVLGEDGNPGRFTLVGGAISGNTSSYYGAGVYVLDGAFNMEGGAISGNSVKDSFSFGGGVYVSGGTFTMKGGIVGGEGGSANTAGYGGGVCVSGHSTFTMEKGAVSGNTAAFSGSGVYVSGECAFIMKGGVISGNSVTSKGTLSSALGGGVCVSNGTFTMEDGVISGNSVTGTSTLGGAMGGGVYVTLGGTFTLERGAISGNTSSFHGAGVYVAGGSSFTMNGGAIGGEGALANVAQHFGGGVAIQGSAKNPSTFKMTGGTISGNRTTDGGGGGVFLTGDRTDGSATFIMEGGEIAGNRATASGGGVYVEQGTFRLTDGAITGNEANYLGGGVHLADGGALKMTGGKITGNALKSIYGDSTMSGAGVYVYSSATMSAGSGSAIAITGNTHAASHIEDNVYLETDMDTGIQKTIGVTGPLADGTRIGVTTKDKPSLDNGFVTFTEGLTSDGSIGAFSSDDAACAVGWNAGKTEAVLGPAISHTANGYTGAYDGAAHGVTVTVTKPASGCRVMYGTRKGTYDRTTLTYADAGEHTVYYQVTADGYIPAEGSAKVNIAPIDATVTVTGGTGTATYDGKAHTAQGYIALASTSLYDVTKDFAFSGTAKATRTGAGTARMGLKASQFTNTNPNFKTVTFRVTDGYQQVTPAAITITADDKASPFGAALSPLTWTVGGAYVAGDDLGIALSTEAGAAAGVGAYPINVAWNGNPNYTAALKAGTYTVTKGRMTVTASGYSGVYDGEAHAIAVTAGGTGAKVYYGSRPLTADNCATAGSTAPITRADVGRTTVYYCVVGDNYEAVSGSKDIDITPKPVSVVADDKAKTYGDDDPKLTYKATGLIGSDRLSGTLIRKKGEKPGAYPIRRGTLKAPANYTVVFTGGTFTIRKRPVAPQITQQATMKPTCDDALRLAWSKVDGAQGYDVFFKACDGKGNYPLVKTTRALSCKIKNLKKGRSYKAYVKAWKKTNGRKVYIGKASPTVHCIVGGYNRRFCNAGKVTVRQRRLTLDKGKHRRIVATVTGVKQGRDVLHHFRLLRYFSSDLNVAKVDNSGTVRGVGRGVCTITVMANNGVSATVRVTVK